MCDRFLFLQDQRLIESLQHLIGFSELALSDPRVKVLNLTHAGQAINAGEKVIVILKEYRRLNQLCLEKHSLLSLLPYRLDPIEHQIAFSMRLARI